MIHFREIFTNFREIFAKFSRGFARFFGRKRPKSFLKMIVFIAAIDSVQFSSKSELSSRFFGCLKFLVIFCSFVRSFVRLVVRSLRPFVLAFDRNSGARFGGARGRARPHRFDQMIRIEAFDRNGGARFGGARGRAGPHRFDQMQNESIFFDFWRRAAHRRQKSKKMRNENF